MADGWVIKAILRDSGTAQATYAVASSDEHAALEIVTKALGEDAKNVVPKTTGKSLNNEELKAYGVAPGECRLIG